jgi:hypothetical protein
MVSVSGPELRESKPDLAFEAPKQELGGKER